MKHIAVISLDDQAADLYAAQIRDFFEGLVSVEAFHTHGNRGKRWPMADLYLINTDAFDEDPETERYLSTDSEYVNISLTFTKKAVERMRKLPVGTKALLVSSSERMCNEAIAKIKTLGIKHIEFSPYYPGVEYTGDMVVAVTPGESRYMPECIQRMVDVGARLLDANTIIEVAMKLGLDHMLEQNTLKNYFSSLADNTYGFDRLFERSIRSEKRLDILLDILPEGIIGVDETGQIFAYNTAAEKITGVTRKRAMNGSAALLFRYIPFRECEKKRAPLEDLLIRNKGMLLNVSIDPIKNNDNYMGMFATIQRFDDQESKQNKLRGQLKENPQHAKYTFDDIIGKSQIMDRACSIAQKMARTNSCVLITGESGTGKELFAHAIHNASPRKDYPFIAINCAALPETLLESELFGYEEGAFTGAKRGGKMGLFEFAHSGSIFLDEVEGMSPSLQIKLLRVLQEKEIMHIGGKGVIHIDVRVIATSNERLDLMVEQGRFRSDLYYRLNTLPISLPPLRERREDIPGLVARFRQEMGGNFRLDQSVWDIFNAYRWKGNIRELRNTIEYLTFLEKDVIYPEDLPPAFSEMFCQDAYPPDAPQKGQRSASVHTGSEAYRFILEQLYAAKLAGKKTGRDALLSCAKQNGLPLSQQDVRMILGRLQENGLVQISVGRGGSCITEKGIEALQSNAIP